MSAEMKGINPSPRPVPRVSTRQLSKRHCIGLLTNELFVCTGISRFIDARIRYVDVVILIFFVSNLNHCLHFFQLQLSPTFWTSRALLAGAEPSTRGVP